MPILWVAVARSPNCQRAAFISRTFPYTITIKLYKKKPDPPEKRRKVLRRITYRGTIRVYRIATPLFPLAAGGAALS